MDDGQRGYQVLPFSRMRRMQAEGMRVGVTRGAVHGLIEADVTRARQIIREHKERTGERLSFTAFAIACQACAVAENPRVQAYRDWRNRLIVFDDVDVNTMAEGESDGEKVVLAFFIRAANRKTYRQLHDEVRACQNPAEARARLKGMELFMRIPSPLRSLFYAVVFRSPHVRKKTFCTVSMSAIGMFGGTTAGAVGGWGVPMVHHSLAITLGGIARRPALVDDHLEEREFLSVTISVDHSIIDGAPAARFAARFKELLETAYALGDAV